MTLARYRIAATRLTHVFVVARRTVAAIDSVALVALFGSCVARWFVARAAAACRRAVRLVGGFSFRFRGGVFCWFGVLGLLCGCGGYDSLALAAILDQFAAVHDAVEAVLVGALAAVGLVAARLETGAIIGVCVGTGPHVGAPSLGEVLAQRAVAKTACAKHLVGWRIFRIFLDAPFAVLFGGLRRR